MIAHDREVYRGAVCYRGHKMKTRAYREHGKCNRCKRIILPRETVGIVGRDNLGRDVVICISCKNLKR